MRLVESDEGGSWMGIEYKCEWEELYISFDMHTRTHAYSLWLGTTAGRGGSGERLYNKLKDHKICSRKDN